MLNNPYQRALACVLVVGLSALSTFYAARERDPAQRVSPVGRAPDTPPAPAAHEAPPIAQATLKAAPSTLFEVELAVKKARAHGADEDAVYRLRAAAMPAQTIALLAERERADAAWMQRMLAWQAQRAVMRVDDAAGLQRLRDASFGVDELAHVAASDRTDAPQLVLD